VATPAPGYRFHRWQPDSGAGTAVTCGLSSPPATSTTYSGSSTCRFVINDNLQAQVAFVDDTDPVMAALTGPSGPVAGPASFTFSAASDPTHKSFECRVPGFREAWAPCVSGVQESPPDGTWTFQVRAVDYSNNRSEPSSWVWTVDTTPPGTEPPGSEPPGSEPPGSEPPGTAPPGSETPGSSPPSPVPPTQSPAPPTPPAAGAGASTPARPPASTRALARVQAITLRAGALKLSKGAIALKVACPAGQACTGAGRHETAAWTRTLRR
jgi:hypothetical protein